MDVEIVIRKMQFVKHLGNKHFLKIVKLYKMNLKYVMMQLNLKDNINVLTYHQKMFNLDYVH